MKKKGLLKPLHVNNHLDFFYQCYNLIYNKEFLEFVKIICYLFLDIE